MHGAARDLHRRFIRLGPRIAEIDLVEIGQRRQLRRDAFLPGNAIEIGGMPQLAGLLAKRGDKAGMRMAKRVHGDAACTVEIATAVISDQPAAIAAYKGKLGATIGLHHGGLRACHRGVFRLLVVHCETGSAGLPVGFCCC